MLYGCDSEMLASSGMVGCSGLGEIGHVTVDLEDHVTSCVIDRIFTIKLGLSQSLMVQKGPPNLNVTLKGYPKKVWGLLDKVAHKTHQMTLFHTPRESILNPNRPRTDL